MPSRFVGVDGEGYGKGRDHRYILLANSYGQKLYDKRGIPTTQCFDFLLAQPNNKRTVFVGFGFNYDVNMMLRDFKPDELRKLREEKKMTWRGYTIEYIPSKWFHVSKDGKHLRVHEVFGFFQSSFIKALRAWGIDPGADMEKMKELRSDFTESMRDDIITYCIDECNKLSELMGRLNAALQAVELRPSNWIGAGSIAAALLRQHGIKKAHQYDASFGKHAHQGILTAYFGGRVELFKQGPFDKLYDYDIISAYPTAAQHLPSLKGASFTSHKGYVEAEQAIYLVKWNVPNETLMPFPVRNKGAIYYPQNGRGWYHAPEVVNALRTYPNGIQVERSLILHPATAAKPFDFIPALFAHRAKLKAEGHPAQKALKLGLNSLYGKLAQGIGYQDDLPPFQSYYWAGRITSETRARAFDIASTNPDALVMIATDGIFFDSPVGVDTSTGLGGLELELLTDCFVAQPGVYAATTSDGDTIAKSRGFFAREIDFDSLREGYDEEGAWHVAEYSSERFIGLMTALHLNSMDDWRTWKRSKRKLSLYPSRKFADGFNPTVHLPPTLELDCSQPYVPKGGTTVFPKDIDPLEYLQGNEQPLKDY